MPNSTLDPKLYEAVRKGNERYIIYHALRSSEERAAFELDAPNDPMENNVANDGNPENPQDHGPLNAEEVANAAGDLNPGDVAEAIEVPAGNNVDPAEDSFHDADNVNPRGHITLTGEVVIGIVDNVNAPGHTGEVAIDIVGNVNREEPADPEQEVPAGPEQEVPAGTENQHPLSGVTCAGDTVLHIAARFVQTKLARKICQVRASLLTAVNDKLETPLHYAAQAGNRYLVRHFVSIARQQNSNIDLGELLRKRNKEGETALYQAVHHQHKDVIEDLAARNAASIPDYKSMSPLYLATVLRSLPIVTCLCQLLPLNVSREAYSGPDGQTALHIATLSNQRRFMQMILWWRPEMTRFTDNSGYTPLHYAAINNNYTAAKILLEKDRASAYIADSSDLYPVHVAAKWGNVRVVIELFKHCPDSGELLNSQGKNFLHFAVEAKRVAVVRWIKRKSVHFEKAMNAQDHGGNTPLHLAVRAGNPSSVFLLVLSKKVHINWLNGDKLTPLDIAFAQMNSGFSDQQNPDYVIYNTLREIGCIFGRRSSASVEAETDQQRDEENEKKEMKSCEGMAKSMSIGSVLIASAASAAAFTVYNIYRDKKDLYDNPRLEEAFQLFFILDAYAFLCSIIATGMVVEAALPFVDLEYRKRYLLLCTFLVTLAAKCFIVAFSTAAYVILTPVKQWLATVIFIVGAIAPLLIQPPSRPNLLVWRTIIRYNALCRGFRRVVLPVFQHLTGNILYIWLVVDILGRQSDLCEQKKWRKSVSCSDQYLVFVIFFLGGVSLPVFENFMAAQKTKAKTKLLSFI